MKLFRIVFGLTFLSLLLAQCKKEVLEDSDLKSGVLSDVPSKMYTVTVENIETRYDFFSSGAEFGVTGGDETPPAHPGTKTSNDDIEWGNVRILNDGFPWPDASQIIMVRIRKN